MKRPSTAMRAAAAALGLAVALAGVASWQVRRISPAASLALAEWKASSPPREATGAALFAFGDFGAIDLDTLETTALPWPVLAATLAIAEAGGNADKVSWTGVETAFKRFGFLYPAAISGQPSLKLHGPVPLGFSLGMIERTFPPLRVSTINVGCAACHAAPHYSADGTPDISTAVLGRPNTSLDIEAFSQGVYTALKAAFADEAKLFSAMGQLFPDMTLRERLSLQWLVMPTARARLQHTVATTDKPLPFANGAPGLTNGVGALKARIIGAPRGGYDGSAGFVSVPDLADRSFRSSFLVDGAYAPKHGERFRTVMKAEADARDNATAAAVASFFMVPSMGLSSARAATAAPDLKIVLDYLKTARPSRFPGPVDTAAATAGREVYARSCAACHGSYDQSVAEPRLLSFPNWAGDVGTDRSRLDAFSPALKAAVDQTPHGRRFVDAAITGKKVAPILSGLWSSAPYLTNGSIPTLRHFLNPETRPPRFMLGGHKLSMTDVGVAGVMQNGVWIYPAGYRPYSTPVFIDTAMPGFSNRGHEKEVEALTRQERDQLLEYLKLL